MTLSFKLKKIAVLCVPVLLASCNAGTQDSTSQTVVFEHMSAQEETARIAVVTQGERRLYDINWVQGKLSGTAKSPELSNFQLASPEVRLPDISLTYDTDGLAGQLYRLYQAAFGRTPDVSGFGYWKDALEHKGLTLAQVAGEFLKSDESKGLYGAQSDNPTFVNRLYQNVLHRNADTDGANYWSTNLSSGMQRVDVLLGFADSNENKTATAQAISKGMAFAEPGIAYIPVSNANGPSDVSVGTTVKVDGSTSTDANSDALHYSWTVNVQPTGSLATFADPTSAKPSISLDKPGTYELTLWVSDGTSRSYSPAKIIVNAHGLVADSGTYTCSTIDATQAQVLYSNGHTYLDRNKDGIACNAADLAYERSPTVPSIADTGTYKCSAITHQTAVLLYLQGHTYLDRDHDGLPCEATDIKLETPVYVPPVSTPSSPSSGMCWVNGYTRKDGTHVKGYWRHC